MNEERQEVYKILELGTDVKNLHKHKNTGGLLYIDLSMIKFSNLYSYIRKQDKEIQRLENIIKEVREYIIKEDEWIKNSDYKLLKTDRLLEILDKDITKKSKKENKMNINKVMEERIYNNYVYASKLFNEQYIDEYRIDLFLDFQKLNIYLRNIKEQTSFKLEILNNCINDLEISEIFKSYEELLNKCYKE